MTMSDYSRFISDCIDADGAEDHGLTDDELYGVYISWCALHRQVPAPGKAFWAALAQLGFVGRRRIDRRFVRPGLRMRGPAAVDYILASRTSLV